MAELVPADDIPAAASLVPPDDLPGDAPLRDSLSRSNGSKPVPVFPPNPGDTAQDVARRQLSEPVPDMPERMGVGEAAGLGLAQGVGMGLAPELTGMGATLMAAKAQGLAASAGQPLVGRPSPTEIGQQEAERVRTAVARAEHDQPTAFGAGEIGGMVAVPSPTKILGPAARGVKAILGRGAMAAGEGAVRAAAGDGDVAAGAGVSAAIETVAGPVARAGGAVARKVAQKLEGKLGGSKAIAIGVGVPTLAAAGSVIDDPEKAIERGAKGLAVGVGAAIAAKGAKKVISKVAKEPETLSPFLSQRAREIEEAKGAAGRAARDRLKAGARRKVADEASGKDD